MQSLETKELVLRVSGEVQASNFDEFEKDAIDQISKIKTELVTDQDFAEAKLTVKSCKTVEDRLSNEINKAFSSMDEIGALKRRVEVLCSKFRETRLSLNKKVTEEEAKRKNEIINNAVKMVQDKVKISIVSHGFSVDVAAIKAATKNKRLLEKMEEATTEEAISQISKLCELEETFNTNTISISESEKYYPGLFPDKNNLALQPVDVVSAQIESRVNKFKFEQAEKERKEKEAEERRSIEAERKAEEERKMKEHVVEKEHSLDVTRVQPEEQSEPVFDPPSHDEPIFGAFEPQAESEPVVFTVTVEASSKLTVFVKIQEILGVISVEEAE